jgi:hypothetical protein
MTVQPDGVTTVKEITVGLKRYLATCDQHPDWHPGSHYTERAAQSAAAAHARSTRHDGIDYADMPATLADALAEVHDQALRIRIARAAKHWKGSQQ